MRTVGRILYVLVVAIFLLVLLVLADAAKAQGGTISSFAEITSCTSTDLLLVERPSPNAYHFITCGNLGASSVFGVAVDLSDNGSDEITRLLRINTSGDTNSIFTETVTDELTIDLSKDWPKADQADALAANGTNCSAGNYPLGVDAAGNSEDCTAAPAASNSFETMNAPAGTDPVADSSTDTLNLAATGILTITGDSTTDTLTFDATEVDGSTTNELQNIFQTVDAPSGTDPVADSTTDTLTLAASGIVTITGDSGTDTITIAATEVDGSTTNEIQNLFETISTTSGTAPVADSSTDTLTLTAGSGITITGDSATDTVTIAATGGGTTITVQEDDSTVDGSTSTLDFTEADATLVTSSPAGEANVNMGLYALLGGRSTDQTIIGNSGTDGSITISANTGSTTLISLAETLGVATMTFYLDTTTTRIFSETVDAINFGGGSTDYQLETGGILGIDQRLRVGDADQDINSACISFASGKDYLYHDTDCDNVEDTGEDALDDDLPVANDITEAMLKVVDSPSDEDVFTYETSTGDFEWHTASEVVANISAGALPNDAVLEADLKSVNAPVDEYCLTYETTTGDFEWQLCSKASLFIGAMDMWTMSGSPTQGAIGGITPIWTLPDAATSEVGGCAVLPQASRGSTFDFYLLFAQSGSGACNFYGGREYKPLAASDSIGSSGTTSTGTNASNGTANSLNVLDTGVNVSTTSTDRMVCASFSRVGAHASDTCNSQDMRLLAIVLEEQ